MDFGADLRQAREQKGVSLREIAQNTKISARALESLEKNDISQLPGGIFTRAIIRSYAAEIGLDPDQAMRDFTEQFPGHAGSWSPVETDDHFESRRQTAGVALGIVAIAVVVGAILLLLNFRTRAGPSSQRAAAQPAAAAPAPSTASDTAPDLPPPAADMPVPAEAPAAAPAPRAPAATPSVTPAPATAVPEGTETLALAMEVSGPCWISVTADGERLFSRQLMAGQSETVRGNREVVIGVGDAGSFKFTINGQPGRVVGKPGEVIVLRINRNNYRSFLANP